MRIKFHKGKQRKFIQLVLSKIGCLSLRSLRERGIDVNYQTLKSYYNEDRTLPLALFEQLCILSGVDKKKMKFKLIKDNWGQKLGGKR